MILREPQGQPEHGRGLIDLHLHTNTSDGRCTPRELVDHASAAGLTTMAVTDHDTTAAVHEVAAYARARAIDTIPGIEITAIEEGIDVHVLGYFIDCDESSLQQFLVTQRAIRVARVEAIVERLTQLGLPVDIGAMREESQRSEAHATGRPQVALAMIAAGYVATVREAFDQWLGNGRPAFVPRTGASPESVIAIIHGAGGLASLAHPARTRIDTRIQALRDAGLDALEAFHSDHTAAIAAQYEALAHRLRLLCTGGSDYHGDPARSVSPGSTSLPLKHWDTLVAARARHA